MSRPRFIAVFIKDPEAELDYTIDWSEWLDTDTIASSSWDVPTGLTATDDDSTSTTATVWLSEGVDNHNYTITNTIVTAGGRTDSRSFEIKIRER